MAETLLKRQREETLQVVQEEEETKRHKSYNHILSILESDDEEANQDISSLISSLQQELSSDNPLPEQSSEAEPNNHNSATITKDPISLSPVFNKDDEEEEEKERVVRHLLEASDDELGIPNSEIRLVEEVDDIFGSVGVGVGVGVGVDIGIGIGEGFSLYDGLWEFGDEAANYYSLLQSDFI